MASALVKIDVHLVFHVKSSGVKLKDADLNPLFAYIAGIIKSNDGLPIEIGGMPDHIHILCSLPKTMTLTDFVRAIKANSSKWIKTQNECYKAFAWQEGYGAFSVSPSLKDKTAKYIRSQAEHHKKRSYEEEYKLFLDAYGVQYDERYAFVD